MLELELEMKFLYPHRGDLPQPTAKNLLFSWISKLANHTLGFQLTQIILLDFN